MIGLGSDKNNSERPVDALAVKKVTDSFADNLKSRGASASKNVTRVFNFLETMEKWKKVVAVAVVALLLLVVVVAVAVTHMQR